MKLTSLIHDYGRAIAAARSRGSTLPAATHSVLTARLRYGLGPLFHSLFELDRRPRATWPDFIGSYELNEGHKSFSRKADRQLTKDKLAFSFFCQEHDIATIPTFCFIDPTRNANTQNSRNCLRLEDWLELFADAPSRLFIKPLDGGHGDGAFSAWRDGTKWIFEGKSGSDADLYAHCRNRSDGKKRWIVQPEIKPHATLMNQLSPTALCTVRVVTYLSGSEVRVPFAVIRIPTGQNETDNYSLGLTGNLIAPIDLQSGRIGTARGSRSKTWPLNYATDTHPDTGQMINGFVVPNWDEVVKLVKRAQLALSQVPTCGWDVAVTDDGPLIVETNSGYGVEIIEVAFQRGVRRDLAETFSYPHVPDTDISNRTA